MRLTEEEEKLIKDYWLTDLDIDLERSRYTAVLESDVRYAHHSNGDYDRKGGSKRGVKLVPAHGEIIQGDYLINPHSDDALESPEDAIEWLDEHGSLLKVGPDVS